MSATASSIAAALKAGADRLSAGQLAELGRRVNLRFGGLVDRYRGDVPLGLALVRIGHETGGNPDAVSREGERGLLQLYPATIKWAGITAEQADDPQWNLWAGFADWNRRTAALHKRYPGIVDSPSGRPWQGLSNLTMSIGEGATRYLVDRVGGGFCAVYQWVAERPGEFAALDAARWGSQSPELVAKRIGATKTWLQAAERVGGLSADGYGRRPAQPSAGGRLLTVALLAAAGAALWRLLT